MSSSIDQAVSAIAKDRREYADAALQQPKGRDAFEFGRVCGLNQGLLMAETKLKALREEEEGLSL